MPRMVLRVCGCIMRSHVAVGISSRSREMAPFRDKGLPKTGLLSQYDHFIQVVVVKYRAFANVVRNVKEQKV